jgi:hypothetical protein
MVTNVSTEPSTYCSDDHQSKKQDQKGWQRCQKQRFIYKTNSFTAQGKHSKSLCQFCVADQQTAVELRQLLRLCCEACNLNTDRQAVRTLTPSTEYDSSAAAYWCVVYSRVAVTI